MDRTELADPLVPDVWGRRMKAATTQRCRQVFDALVGRRSGIVREVRLVATIDGDADLHHAAATLADAHPHSPADTRLTSGGSGRTPEDALMAALGEALERYLASSHSRHLAALRPEADLPHHALSAAEFAQFSRQQRRQQGFPFQPATPKTPLRWLWGRGLSDGAPCGVPALAVYLPYQPEPGEPLVAPGISTGLSCADSVEAAVLGGICEVIERDALALTWLGGMSPRPVARNWLLQHAGDLLPPADAAVAYDLTSDLDVPVVLVVCRGEGPRGPLLSVGSACNLDPRRAVRKAAIEASQDRVFVRQLLQLDPDWRPSPDFSNLTDFSLHARLYSVRPDLAEEALKFLAENPQPSDLPARPGRPDWNVAQDRRRIVERLRQAGHDGAWIDLTPARWEVSADAIPAARWGVCADAIPAHRRRAANLDLCVVKVVVPSLLPLHGHHLLPYLGHARLANRRSAMPRSVVNHRHAIWPYPHPFP